MQPELPRVPELVVGSSAPLQRLERHLLREQVSIEAWFRQQWLATPAPFYASIDLRNAGFKLAPVDTNLFPAGFNNLSLASLPLCVQAVQAALERAHPTAQRVLLVPESHTRNPRYLESLASLEEILTTAGLEVRLGSLLPELREPLVMDSPSGRSIRLAPLIRDGNRVGIDGFFPCFVLLNNDLANGVPPVLEGVSQPIAPPPGLGWASRLKSSHFALYQEVAEEFSRIAEIDPWLINPLFRNCGEVNFMTREGEECLAANAQTLLQQVEKKYDEYGLDYAPFVVVKADAGTYGMGVMTVRSAEHIRALNRKQRTRMAATKGGRSVTQVILQEGVYTFEACGAESAPAEPVVYTIDRHVVGGFYRVHSKRGPDENLNAPGMHFEPLPFAESCIVPDPRCAPDDCPNRFYAYGVLARLALLAAARELANLTGPSR
jgi:glutamate--cysteine ligase